MMDIEFTEPVPGNSLDLEDGLPCLIDINGTRHKCLRPEFFNTRGGTAIGYADNFISKVIASYGSEEAAVEAANEAAVAFDMGGITNLSELSSHMYLLVAMSVR